MHLNLSVLQLSTILHVSQFRDHSILTRTARYVVIDHLASGLGSTWSIMCDITVLLESRGVVEVPAISRQIVIVRKQLDVLSLYSDQVSIVGVL